MTEEKFQDESKRAHSVPRNEARGDSGFSVKASPFNPVKLELGFILLFAFFLLMIIHRITEDSFMQLTILTLFGISGMGWLIFRARQVVHQQKKDTK